MGPGALHSCPATRGAVSRRGHQAQPGDRAAPGDGGTPAPRARRHRWVPVVVAAVVYALASTLANGSSWAHGVTHTLQTSGGNDVGEEVWFLAQTPWALLHGHNPFANNWLNAPVGLDLMDNTTMPLLGLLFAPVTLLFGPIATFNVVLDFAIWASAMSFFLMARRFTSWWPAAFAGGLLYGFSPFTAAVANGHLFLLFQAVPPLLILFVDRFVRSPSASPWWSGAAVGACYVVEFYVSTESFATLVVMTACAVVILGGYALLRRLPLDPRRLAAMGACAVGVVVLGAGLGAWTALEGPEHIHGPVQSATAIAGMSTDPLGLVVPTLDQHFTLGHAALGDSLVASRDAQWRIAFESPIENGTYVGAPLLVALVVAVVLLRRNKLVLFCAAMGVLALVLSLGTQLHVDGHRTGIPLPYALLAGLPLMENAIASRWFCYVWLFAALILALGVDALHGRLAAGGGEGGLRRFRAPAACGLLLVAVLLPLVPAWPYPAQAAQVPAWFTGGARALPVGTTAVVYPSSGPASTSAMVWQAVADMRFRMVGGYAVFPTSTGTATFDPQPTALGAALAACAAGGAPELPPASVRSELRAVQASTVVVVPGTPGAPCAARLFHDALGPPRPAPGVLLWHLTPSRAPRNPLR